MFRRKEDRRARLEQLSVNNLRTTMDNLSQDRSRQSDTLLINRLTQVYDNIRKSENDHRQYRVCKLANEMKVFLISDPTTDQAAAALSVNYGYKHDYVEGTALAYQHMLYTSRPNNLFAKYVRKNSGTIDSQTYHEFTTYYFDIKATVFRPVLRHFAELFKELPDISEKELEKIITSTIYEEGKRLRQNTKYRLSRLFKWNIRTDHGMTKNRCGFMHTAYEKPPETRPDVKTILKLLFPIEYGADIMSLCVMGKESLDDLHRMVLRFFSSVPMQRFHNPPLWYQPEFETVRKIWCRDIAVDESRLYILYAIDNINTYKTLALDRFLAYLITYRGKKTFASVLESKGWITWIEAARHPCGTFYNFMIVGMKLTEEGLKHVDDIVGLFFQLKSMLKKRNLRWIFNEFKEVQELKFRFETKQPIANYVRYIAQKMHYSNKEVEIIDVLRNGFTPSAWSTFWKSVVDKDYMSRDYKSPYQMRIFIIDKSSKGYIRDNELIHLEPECLIPYKLEIVPKDTLDRWMKARPEFELPASNEFLPTMVTLKPLNKKQFDYVFVATNSDFLRLWHKQCPKFNLLKLNIFLHFTCPSIKNSSDVHFNLMFARLIRDSFHDDVYAAALVNLKWEIDATAHGILVKITGWDNKQPLLLEKIIDRILDFKLNLETFVAARQYNKQLSISEIEKFEKAQSYDQAHEYLLHLLTDRPMRSEVFQEYSHVTFETFEEFVSKVFSELHIESLLHGNIILDEVLKIEKLIEKKFREKRMKPLDKEKWLRSPLINERDIKMEDNHHYVFKAYNKHHRGTSTKVFYQFSKQSLKRNVITQFIREIIEQHYDNLMEKQSLDHYHVHCRVLITKAIQGLTFLFHSSCRHMHLKITKKIDQFLLFIKDYIKNLSKKDFQKKKAEFILRHRNQFEPKTMYEEATEIWNEIVSANHICNRAAQEQKYLQEMTLQNVKNFCEQFIHKRTPKLVVHVTHEKNKDCSSESEGHNITVIDNIQSFKELCGLKKVIPSNN